MDTLAIVTVLGGLGMFLLGIHHLTEGLKSLAGDSLRRILQRFVSGRLSAIASGVVLTAATQSSTATSLTVIGFVSAGLVTVSQAIAVIAGATLGTTTTPWMVAFFGFQVRIADWALPILGIGAFLWLIGSGRARPVGAILAGFGLIFTGIDYLQTGMAGVSWNLEALVGDGWFAIVAIAGLGVLMTVVMQSSSAAAAATLVALDAGSITFLQGCAMVVGQSVGSAVTTAIVVIGGSVAVKRTALAHVLFSVGVAGLALAFILPLSAGAGWVGARLGDADGVLALAAFSTIFKLAGIVVFFPFLGRLADLVTGVIAGGRQTAVQHLDPRIAEAGGSVALEAAYRAVLELSRDAFDAVRRRLAGMAAPYEPPREALRETARFLESLSLETTDLGTIAPRLVRLVHALDHLTALHGDFLDPPPASPERPRRAARAGAEALGIWLDATADPGVAPAWEVNAALEAAAAQARSERDAGRQQLLEQIALHRMPMDTARARIESLHWTNDALYHAWRLSESLRLASDGAAGFTSSRNAS